MAVNLRGRHFLSMLDFSREEILAVLATAADLKRDFAARGPAPMAGKTLAMIFQKPSLRTRVSFETGMTQLGGHAIYLSPSDISLGKRETTEDIALVLSRFVDVIMARVFGHGVVEELARYAGVPVINGLSDFEHPCQILADFQTMKERKGRLEGLRACYLGDGNNVAHSLMYGAALIGMHMTIITPPGYEPVESVRKKTVEISASTGSKIVVSNDLQSARGADVLYTDVWASMGQEDEAAQRKKIFAKYHIDENTMNIASADAVILHCLPAHYGDEIDYETSRRPGSALFDQAENRLHAQKALLVHLAGG